MKLTKLLLIALPTALTTGTSAQTIAAHFDMSLKEGKIIEQVSHSDYAVASQLPASQSVGVDGDALRFDGYSNYVKAALPQTLSGGALTVQVTLAAETYPMMQVDAAETTPTYGTICGNLADDGRRGFALQLSSQGDLRLSCGLVNGATYRNVIVNGSQKLERGLWHVVTAVFDKSSRVITLYLDGNSIATQNMGNYSVAHNDASFYIGKDAADVKSGPFLINTFCGLIDDITIYNEVVTLAAYTPQTADFNYPDERYAESLWRPQFHGMPSGSWTNETHGMTYSGGRYHVFFQKNANGPYMSRLHWGHISSENLYDWTEEPIAICPDQPYDIKGCWSGCVYEDGGDTYLLYTAVDNAKATIAQAKAKDSNLVEWEKQGIVINGRPSGLSDDFRDPYFFTANGQKYIIVGTSKNGIGACTLHKYQNGAWTNDGTIFFQGGNANQHGTFWEMPNVTDMGNGKWLFTCTPLNTNAGVRTLCWVGTIGTDGTFSPLEGQGGAMQYLEMGGISRDGYGLLSLTIYSLPSPVGEESGVRFLLLGIVPDKLPTQTNFEMGWAHNYSLPRELSLDASGQLVQKPYGGLTAMRSTTTATVEESLLGSKPLVSGRQIELLGEFTPTSGTCGFRFLKNATLTYEADTRRLTLDLTGLSRIANDNGTYNGIYSATLTEQLTKLHLFLDGSILDIFVNDRWAYSVRLFPTEATQVEAEVFATASTPVKVSAWTLDAKQQTGIAVTTIQKQMSDASCFDLCGRKLNQPGKGITIRNGKKYVCR